MADLLNIPLQDNYETTLSQALTASGTDLTLYVNTTPNFTFPSSTQTRIVVNPGKDNMEVMKISAYDSSAKTLTVPSSGRAQPQYNGHSASVQAHAPGSKVIISDNYAFWDDIKTAIATKMDKAGGTFTGDVNFSGAQTDFRIPNKTTAEILATTSPGLGSKVMDTDRGVEQTYGSSGWQDVGTSTPIPNAADHTAGKVDIASATEIGAGTATDGTSGAINVIPVSQTVKTSSGAGDENKLPVLGASGILANGFHNQSLVGGATTLADSLHSHITRVTTYTAGETLTVSGNPLAVHVSDGTNGRTTGRVYLSDGDDATNGGWKFAGFVTATAASGATATVKTGIVSGFTGLTSGVFYYLNNTTAGGVTASTDLESQGRICVGRAISTTQIDTDQREQMHFYMQDVALTIPVAISGTNTTNILLNFKPWRIEYDGYLTISDDAGGNTTWTVGKVLFGANGSIIKAFRYNNGASAANLTFGGLSVGSTFSVAPGAGANRSSLALTVASTGNSSFNFVLTNVITAGTGSTNGQEGKGLVKVWGYNT